MQFRRHRKDDLLKIIVDALNNDSWNVSFLNDSNLHPFILRIEKDNEQHDIKIYVWNLTHGGGAARATDEYRIQITGVDQFLPLEGGKVLILGWWKEGEVFAGFDFNSHKKKLGKSPSIQIKEEALRNGYRNGISTWQRDNNEIALAIRPDFISKYIQNIEELHSIGDAIIETDQDTKIEDRDEGGLYPYDPAYESIEIGEDPFSIFEYLRQLEKGKIKIQPDFQRNQVWKPEQKSKFIESIILNFPLPPIYLNETKESNYIVIDGLQRSTALRQFYKGEYVLKGLEALPKYNGYKFKDLPESLQSKFEDKKLTVFILKPSTPMVVIYDLFNRINTGGTQLNRQEVRNCIYIGKSTQLLKNLAEQNYYKEAIWWGVSDKRMKDREVALRYIAFRWFDYENEYSGDMSDYVESAMKRINQMSDEKIYNIKEDFERVMKWSYNIWGNKNFRIATEYTRGTINTAILESVCNYLSKNSDFYLDRNKNTIKNNYIDLISNEIYYQAVTKSTGNKAKVLDRFRLAHTILSKNTI